MSRLLRSQPTHPKLGAPILSGQVFFGPQVNLATGLLTNQRRAQQRRPTTVILGSAGGLSAFPSLPVLDAFSGFGTGGLVGAGGDPRWLSPVGGIGSNLRLNDVSSGTVNGSAAQCGDYFAATAFPANCGVSVDIVRGGSSANDVLRLKARTQNPASTTARNDYEVRTDGTGAWWLGVTINNVVTLHALGVTQNVVAGDKIGITCVGGVITAWWFDGTSGSWKPMGSIVDTSIPTGGYFALVIQATVNPSNYVIDNLAGGPISQYALPAMFPQVGSHPPLVVGPIQTSTTITTNLATGLLTNQRRAGQRRPRYVLYPPTVVAVSQPPGPPVSVTPATGLLTNQRRPQERHSTYVLYPPTVVGSGQAFFGPQVNLLPVDRLGRRHRRAPLISTALFPPAVLQTFAGPEVTLVALRTRYERQRRRLPDSFLLPPATLEPEAVALAERQIRVDLARTRPRKTVGTRLDPPVFYPQTGVVSVNLATGMLTRQRRAQQRRTSGHVAAPIFYAATSEISATLARHRPRRTRSVLGGPIFYAATSEIAVTIVRTRPRRTSAALFEPTTVASGQVFSGPKVALVAVRPPRRTTRLLGGPTVLQTFAARAASLVRIRPRRTAAHVYAPATLEPESVGLLERQIRVVLARTRPRHAQGTRLTAVSYPATSEIGVTLARVRPRRTRAFLTSIVYPATSEITVALTRVRPRHVRSLLAAPAILQTFVGAAVTRVRIRPRRPFSELLPPATLEPETIQIAERQIRVSLARIRPRHTVGTRLTAVSYPAASNISVTLARIRPRRTRWSLTAVSYAATSEIVALLQRIRPRPTTSFLGTPIAAAQTFAGPLVSRTRIRPRHVTSILMPPATLEPESVQIAEREPRVVLTKTRSRKTLARLSPPVFYPKTSQIAAKLVRTRPRHTLGTFLGSPTVLRVFAAATVTLTRIRPRPTVPTLAPPTVVRVPSVEQAEQTIRTALVRTRPRPTTRVLQPPRVVVTNPPVVTEISVTFVEPGNRRNWNRRRTEEGFAGAPVSSSVAEGAAKVVPHAQTYRFVGPRPPRVLAPVPTQGQQTVSVSTVAVRVRNDLRRRGPDSRLYKPTTLQTFPGPDISLVGAAERIRVDAVRRQPRYRLTSISYPATSEIAVTVVRIRPKPTRSSLTSVSYRQKTRVAVVLAGRSRLDLRRRAPRSILAKPTILAVPAVVQAEDTVRVVLAAPTRLEATRRAPHAFLTSITYARVSALLVALAGRTRAELRRRAARLRLAPPTVVTAPPAETQIAVRLTRIRPQPTRVLLPPPPALQTFAAVAVTVALGSRLSRVVLTLSRLGGPAVVAEPPVESLVRVAAVRARPQPTVALLQPPTTLAPPPVVTQTSVTTAVEARLTLLRKRTRHFIYAPIVRPAPLHGSGVTSGYVAPTGGTEGGVAATGETDGEVSGSASTKGGVARVAGTTTTIRKTSGTSGTFEGD